MAVLKTYINGEWKEVSGLSSHTHTMDDITDFELEGVTVYAQSEEPIDAPDGSVWIDSNADSALGKEIVLAPSKASIGQVLVVADVDDDGRPIAWGAVSPHTYVVSCGELGIDNTGTTDVTALLQAAIDKAHSDGFKRVEFEPGAYLISSLATVNNGKNSSCGGLVLHSNTEYDFNGAVIKMAQNSSEAYNILFLEYLENVTILNVELIGDRAEHNYGTYPTYHVHGYGIGQYSCKNVRYENIIIHDCIGDGVYFGFGFGGSEKQTAEYYNCDCVIKNSEIYNVRRNGLLARCIVNLTLDNVHIHDVGMTIDDITGVAPKSGINIDPIEDYEWTENILIYNSIIENTAAYPIRIGRCVSVNIDGCKIISDGTYANSIYVYDMDVTTVYVKDTRFVGFEHTEGYVDRYENCDMGGMTFFRVPQGLSGSLSNRVFMANNCINVCSQNVFNYQKHKLKAAFVTNCHFTTWLPVYIHADSLIIDSCSVDAVLSKGFYHISANVGNTVVSNCNIKIVKDIMGAISANTLSDGDLLYTGCKFHFVHDLELERDYDNAIIFTGKHDNNDFICEGVGIHATSIRNCNFEIYPSNSTLVTTPAYFNANTAYNCVFDGSNVENIKFAVNISEQYCCVWKVNHSKAGSVDMSKTTKFVKNIFENIGSVKTNMPNYNATNYTFTDHDSLWINSAVRSY